MPCLDVFFARENGLPAADADTEAEAVNWLSWEL